MLDVVKIENALPAVFEPFVEDLIAADLVFPHFRLYTLKILSLVDIDPLLFWVVALLLYSGISFALVAADGFVQFWRFEEMEVNQLLSIGR